MAAKSTKSIFAYLYLPLAALILALVLTSLHTYFILYASVNRSFRTTLANQKATQLATFFDQRQNQIQRHLETVANGETIVSLFVEPDLPGLADMEELLVQTIPYAIKVKLIPFGSAKIELDTRLPFSFTSKDMVNRTEQNLRVFAEAIPSDDDWIITMAQAVHAPGSDRVVGTLFVYLSRNAFIDDLELTLGGAGEVVLMQQFGAQDRKPIILFGEAGNDAWTPVARGLESPHWDVQFTPSSGITGADLGSALGFLLPLGLFFVIALLGLGLGAVILNRNFATDVQLLLDQIGASSRGANIEPPSYRLTAISSIHELVVPMFLRRVSEDSHAAATPVKRAPLVTAAKPQRQPVAEVEIEEMDEEALENALAESTGEFTLDDEPHEETMASIFRAYDIRGIVDDTLTMDSIHRIGLAIGSEALARGEQTIVVGADGRSSSPDVASALIGGLRASGRDVVDLGMVPTPLLYFATQYLGIASGVMVTASHNPPEYNGFKVVLAGETLEETGIARIYKRFHDGDFTEGNGGLREEEVVEAYIATVCDDIVIAQPLKLVIDCGNGVAGSIAPALFEELGCEVVELYCDVDGTFPNHAPDPSVPENLTDLAARVTSERADLGISFDGDGDRFVAVAGSGEIIWPDRLLMLFAKDVVSRNPGSDVIYDVKCTRHLNGVISSFGGRPILCKSGHSFMKAKLAQSDALLAGEMSGHIYFRERWNGFDDGLYAAARLLELVSSQASDLKTLLAEFPHSLSTPEIRVPIADGEKFEVIAALSERGDFGDGTITSIDGLRVDYSDGWGLVRVSNTTPNLVLRFEADNVKALERIKSLFKTQIEAIRPGLSSEY